MFHQRLDGRGPSRTMRPPHDYKKEEEEEEEDEEKGENDTLWFKTAPCCDIGWTIKKHSMKVKEKCTKKMKMTLQRAENLVHVEQHHGDSFCIKIFFSF